MDVNEQMKAANGNGVRLERVLLAVTLALQVIIMAWLYQQHRLQQDIKQSLVRLEETNPRLLRTDIVRPAPLNIFPLGARRPNQPHPLSNPYAFPEDNVQAHLHHMMADAFENFERMSSLMNFDAGWEALSASPTMDMRELDDRYEVIYSLPGLNAAELQVMLEGRLLTVSSSGQDSSNPRGAYNQFESRVQLPGPVGDPREANADFTNGVLKVSVPRATGQEQLAQPVKLM
ncbi:MAG: hypothetical protein A2X46_11090 [Lentisphaerae bacterium GWF2_57_35]|nr:MAG: hypothetical protein A2X46_11090 [Lentisphaerae bacterium GWF2_57_35]